MQQLSGSSSTPPLKRYFHTMTDISETQDHYVEVTENVAKRFKESPSGAGTTKRKELHGTTPIRAMFGSWADKNDDGVDFFGYKISFGCSIGKVLYSSFVLLVGSKLADDVGNIDTKLYLGSRYVKCKVSSCVEELHLTAEEVAKGKCFQELFFNGMFGKMYIGSKQLGEPKEFLLQTDTKLWNPSYMFLLLPLESLEPFKINWKEIDSSVSVVASVKKYCLKRAEDDNVGMDKSTADSENMIHFGNKSIHKDNVKDVVVLAMHSGKIYYVVEFLENETAFSPFDGNAKRFPSFVDYFKRAYDIDLKYPGRKLLLVKQSHKPRNHLVDFNGKSNLHGKKIKAESHRQSSYVRIPCELLLYIETRIDVMKSIYLLPSLMNRLESLMLASQLREQINGDPADLRISAPLILEAITTVRCNESFSMKRLELLGDSVLKFAVSCDLYLKDVKNHEGHLSSRRSWQVCNSTLYDLGISRHLQGYIRDAAFDPTRWTAPGQLLLKHSPCDHGIETMEVPIEPRYRSEDPKIISGKACDMGHRWLCSKTVSDCVEALVGAYFVDNGLDGAIQCMKWFGISCELDPSTINEALQIVSLHVCTPKLDVLECLESKLGYQFVVKGLLLEAITHPSGQYEGAGCSYQKLKFVGESVLELLITKYLYHKHGNIDQSEVADLRSASVNNVNLAYSAVRRDIHLYLQHCSSSLQGQIDYYMTLNSLQTKEIPKALSDLVQSISGAILMDTKLNLDQVWRIVEPLLSPIVTPDKLELPPLRELIEWCDSMGYFIKEKFRHEYEGVTVELRLQLKDTLLVEESLGSTRKIAKGQAAFKLLRDLEKRGMLKKTQSEDIKDIEFENYNIISDTILLPKPDSNRNIKITLFDTEPSTNASIDNELEIPVLKSINTKKGGPRSSLYELCKKMQWPLPTYTTTEQKSTSLKQIGGTRFESVVSLTICNYGVVELTGDGCSDKKSSCDSAALLVLYELQKLGKLKVG